MVRGLLLGSLGVPVTCFAPSVFCSWKASQWPLYPSTRPSDVRLSGLDVTTFRTRRATAPSRTRKARVKLGSSARDEAPADSTAAATRAPTFGDGSAASSLAEDGRPPSTSSSSAVDGIRPRMPSAASSASSSLVPLALLNAVTLLWGTQHAVIKLVLQEDLSPGVTNFARFGVAALLFSPWTPGVLRSPPSIPFSPPADDDDDASMAFLAASKEEDKDIDGGGASGAGGAGGGGGGDGSAAETWKAGAELGLWMFMGFAFQSIGLGYTTAR